jgi:hypothetical protein
MKFRYNITIFLFVFSLSVGKAQTDLPKNELDTKYTPNASSMFNNLVKKSYDENSYTEIEFKDMVNYSPTMLVREKIFFVYERDVYKGIALTAGLGKAFGKDFVQNAWHTLNISNFSDITVLSPQQALSNCSYLGSGPLMQLGSKIYFSGTTFDEAFFEFNYRYEKINYLLNTPIDNRRIDGENDLSFKMSGFSFGFGYTTVTGEKSNLVHEFYINFGLKTFKFTHYDLLSVKNPVTDKSELIYRKADDFLSTRILPSMNIGYAFGFGW